MTKDDIIAMARQAGFVVDEKSKQHQPNCIFHTHHVVDELLERFAAIVAAAKRNKIAAWMMAKGYATGHGDTVEDLLNELEWQVKEGERKVCAAIARQWDVDHPTTNYGGCIANKILAMEQS